MVGVGHPELKVFDIDPNELVVALKGDREEYYDHEERVLKRYCLDNPATESNYDPDDIVGARTQLCLDGCMDTCEEYCITKHGERVLKQGVQTTDMITVWPHAIWAAVFAARENKSFEDMKKQSMDYFWSCGY